MEFDDVTSKYMGFREKEKIAKNLAIVFSGSYTSGNSVVKESQIQYVLTETNGDYVATAKENMHRHSPKIVMLQNTANLKSVSERFCLRKTSHTKNSLSYNPLLTPISTIILLDPVST